MTWRPDCSSARGRRPETSRKKKKHDRRPLRPGTAGRRTGPKNRQVGCRSAGPRGPAGGPRTGRRPLLRTKRRSAAGPRTCSRPKPRHVVSDRKTVTWQKKKLRYHPRLTSQPVRPEKQATRAAAPSRRRRSNRPARNRQSECRTWGDSSGGGGGAPLGACAPSPCHQCCRGGLVAAPFRSRPRARHDGP